MVMLSVVYQQTCKTCRIWEGKGKAAPVHACAKNYTGSSKGMESAAIVEMAKKAPSKGIMLGTVVSDDDSTMQAQMTHLSQDNPKGKLPP